MGRVATYAHTRAHTRTHAPRRYTPEGLEVLKGKSKALRILEAKPRAPSGVSLRQVGSLMMKLKA